MFKEKLTLILDFDEVIAPLEEIARKEINKLLKESGRLPLKRSATKTYHFSRDWGVDEKNIRNVLSEVYYYPKYYGIEPIKGAQEGIKILYHAYRLVIATDTSKAFGKPREAFANRKFEGRINSKDFNYTGLHSGNGIITLKHEIGIKKKAVGYVDDITKYTINAVKAGIPNVSLFGRYNWNKGRTPDGVTRLTNWKELTEFYMTIAREQYGFKPDKDLTRLLLKF